MVSGFPKTTPIFIRIWLMKTTIDWLRETTAVSFRSAWLMSLACSPMCESPMSPSISAFGTRAATESTTTRSHAPDRTSCSEISSACSPVSGCETSRSPRLTPRRRAYVTSSACSASTNAATPPWRCTSAIAWSASVVFPDDSGPKISTTRPRGSPPTPSARSSASEPVETTATGAGSIPSPSRMMLPFPNCFSIPAIARPRAFTFSVSLLM